MALKVKDIVDFNNQKEVQFVESSDSIHSVAKKMLELHMGFFLVKSGGEFIGLISERDLIYKVLATATPPEKLVISDIMTTEIVWANSADDLKSALSKLKGGNFRHLPIKNEKNEPIAVISERDITSFLLNRIS
ncbi:MAG: CBS domain-containing protein [Bacteriovoracaceae bacterium]|jgi:CBS domain-containing protein|nr:CBS domain-containing protein [Bacteriovoracaceae bacterium]